MHYVNGVRDQRHPESKGYKQEPRNKGRSPHEYYHGKLQRNVNGSKCLR